MSRAGRSFSVAGMVIEYVLMRVRVQRLYPRSTLPTLLDGLTARSSDAGREVDLQTAVRAGERVAARLALKNTCLFRALARYGLLSRRHPGQVAFHLGLPCSGAGAGHAWVTIDDVPFLDAECSAFACTYTHRRPAAENGRSAP